MAHLVEQLVVLAPDDPDEVDGKDVGVEGAVLGRQEPPEPVEGLGLGYTVSGLPHRLHRFPADNNEGTNSGFRRSPAVAFT